MNVIKNNTIIRQIGLISLLFTAPILAIASPSDQDDRGVSGTIICGGNHFNRLNNTESQRTTYTIRNFNADLPIRIDRLTAYDATGAVIVEYDATTLPASFNNVLPIGDNSLEPFQTAQYRTTELIGAPLATSIRPIQVHFEWSSDARALIPELVGVRTVRRQEITLNPDGSERIRSREERGRHLKECRSVSTVQGRRNRHDKDDD